MEDERMNFLQAIRDLTNQPNEMEKYYSEHEINKLNKKIKKHVKDLSKKYDNER